MNFPFIRFNTNPILLTYLEKPSDYFWRNSNGEWSQYHMEAFYQPLREKCKVNDPFLVIFGGDFRKLLPTSFFSMQKRKNFTSSK